MKKKKEKKFDINKEIDRCGNYINLCFKENDKVVKYDYDRELYCEILRVVANEEIFSMKDRSEFLVSYYQIVSGLLDDDAYENEEINSEKEKEKFRKRMDRIHNRILLGKEPITTAVASDKICYYFLRQVEEYSKRLLLTLIVDDKPFYFENKYIYSLVKQLIEMMYASETFNYVPNSKNFQRNCYRNHLKMIENNIKDIFENEVEIYSKWREILCPLQQLIYECNYPGIKKEDIWYHKCEELRFFDVAYEIAKNYEVYRIVKERLEFDLGNTKEEVNFELKKCYQFFHKDKQNEKILFYNTMLNTFKKIINDEFDLDV